MSALIQLKVRFPRMNLFKDVCAALDRAEDRVDLVNRMIDERIVSKPT